MGLEILTGVDTTVVTSMRGFWHVRLAKSVLCRAPKVKLANEDSMKEQLLQAAEVSDTAADPINFKSSGSLKHSPNSAVARKETV